MKKCTLTVFILLGLILISSKSRSQVEVTTNDSKIYRGFVMDDNAESILLRNFQKQEIRLNKSKIKKLIIIKTKVSTYSAGDLVGLARNFSDTSITIQTEEGYMVRIPFSDVWKMDYSDSPTENRITYGMFGGTMSTFGGLTAVGGYQGDNSVGIRVQAGYFAQDWGLQGNIMYNISKSTHFEHNLSLGAGYSYEEDNEYGYYNSNIKITKREYIGAYYDLNTHGFFFEIGITTGIGTVKDVRGSFQIGYVYRFN